MKRCPQCSRDYTDDTLSFCLDDGAALLDGPASMDEPQTAILPDADSTSESPTRTFEPPPDSDGHSNSGKIPAGAMTGRFRSLATLVGVLVIGLAAAGIYWYYFRTSGSQIESIAVMPFVNESGDADLEYLADGMTESLITSLSAIPDLSVKARSSVFRFKAKEFDSIRIGSELKVQALLIGRLTPKGDGLSVRLELVNTEDETVLWSESFDKKAGELVALQKEIARDVSSRLRLSLSSDEQNSLTKIYTENSEAHRSYLQGRFHLEKRNVKEFEKARRHFEKAIELDPNYVLAQVGLADTYSLFPVYDPVADPKQYLPLAKEAALRAIRLDPELGEAHATLGHVLFHYYWDFPAAERSLKRALEIDPGYATAHLWYSEYLGLVDRHDEALTEVRIAAEMEPFSLVINRILAVSLANNGRDEEALAQLARTIELFPNDATSRQDLADLLAHQGKYSEAVKQALEGRRLGGMDAEWLERVQKSAGRDGWKGYQSEFAEYCEEMRRESGHFSSYSAAQAYAFIGKKDKALEALGRAFEERDTQLAFLKQAFAFESMREDPRFKEIVGKIGLKK